MNEIEIQKLIVKEAFNKSKPMPDFGPIGEDSSIKLRNYIWKVCGYLDQGAGSSPTKQTNEQRQAASQTGSEANTKSKKAALVIIYRLWSAFTKNMRYIIEQKGKSVCLNRFGTFCKGSNNEASFMFIPSTEMVNLLNAQSSSVN